MLFFVKSEYSVFIPVTAVAKSRKQWDENSCGAVLNAFGDALNEDGHFPSGAEISHLIETTPVSSLRHRTVPQIRTWLHTQKKIMVQDRSLKKTEERQFLLSFIQYSKKILK